MTDREKVIKGLEQFISDFKPYCGNESDWGRVFDALELLKAQEPRVMSLDEVKAIKSCWIEDEDAGIVYPAIYECQGNPSEKGQYAVFVIEPDSGVLPEDCDDDIVDDFNSGNRWLWETDINKAWRPWNMCPTETQMEAVKWNG